MNVPATTAMNKTKMQLAVVLLALSWLAPLAGFWVSSWQVPVATKGVIIGLLTLGVPEILTVIAIALVGKEGFKMIVAKVKEFIGLAPKAPVPGAQ